ncbi:hypothetical protein OQH61_03285 [Helicobacter sp. MIT 21-1697]|uniref:hypothetical protein n=1 Tax=Helicobacter sp. MIT 21-1697 TaxID=2993733 RepID=UPI00224AB7F8|nr:hypothetical protein [Helicobacter sp. MIT 21-1697]MCX2716756.1 hypothetical protein [Helicobacter sp. MIT 21-1697]
MHIKGILIAMVTSVAVIWADNMILDFETISRIELNLKSNQTLMIDHKRGVLLGIMEISPSGAVKQLPIPPELLGKSEADIMGDAKPKYDKTTSHFGGSPTTFYHKNIKGKAKIPSGNEKGVEDLKKGTKKREGNMEWDKSKIIYEQQEQILDVLR